MIDDNNQVEDGTGQEWAAFDDRIEMLDDQERADIADYLGLTIDPSEPWQTYRDEFGRESWKDFTQAYESVTRQKYDTTTS